MTELDYIERNQRLWTEWASDYAKAGLRFLDRRRPDVGDLAGARF